jgi:hypothetical protein
MAPRAWTAALRRKGWTAVTILGIPVADPRTAQLEGGCGLPGARSVLAARRGAGMDGWWGGMVRWMDVVLLLFILF